MRRLGYGFAALLLAVSVVTIQGQSPQAAAGSRSANTFVPSKDRTITGCLKPASTAGMFVLMNATDGKEGRTGSALTQKNMYTIVGVIPPSIHLKDHVNHKVELTGSIVEDGKFEMANFKMLSPTCP
jgi:hypothetical protein